MNPNLIASIAGLVGEPARAAMLMELMDERELTAAELAGAGNVTPQTASRHLAQLVDAGLVRVRPRGRHRFHRLASPEVARLLESLGALAAGQGTPRRPVVTGPRDEALRRARTCYDHIAGRLGVAIAERLVQDGAVALDDDAARLTPEAPAVLARWQLPAGPEAAGTGRIECRPCLDWSERRAHLGGRLGALLCRHCLAQGWLGRRAGSRALLPTPKGALALRERLGAEAWGWVAG